MTREEREAAIAYIKTYRKLDEDLHNNAPKDSVSYYATDKCLKYWDMAIKALSQEPISLNDINNALGASFRNGVRSAKVEQEPCEDAISRETIEDIKADIEAARYGLINDGLDVALRIIDKHMEGR